MTKIAFVGTGNFARQHAVALKAMGVSIVGCYGTNQHKTLAFAHDFQCAVFPTAETLLSSSIDALYIVIPPFAHDGRVEQLAVTNKIPFFCEKPVGLNVAICNQIASEVARTQLVTSIGYLLRYAPIFAKIKKILTRNKISTIRICSYTHMPTVHWWRQQKLSGGMMLETGSHYIDLLRFLFGDISHVAAFTAGGFANQTFEKCDTYDAMEAILKFESGPIASIGITHLLNNIFARRDELQIYGQDFALKLDLYQLRYQNEAKVFYKECIDKDWKVISFTSSKEALLHAESFAFLEAIRCKNPDLIKSSYGDALKTLKVALAMNAAASNEVAASISY